MTEAAPAQTVTARDYADPLAQPIFVVAPPRAGARVIARALGAAEEVWSAGSVQGALLAGVPELDPRDGSQTARLTAADCSPAVRHRMRDHLRAQFAHRLRHLPGSQPRLLDASPRNSLMVPFLHACFPDARFVYVHRHAPDTLAESLAFWEAGTAATRSTLPAWTGPRWSFLLVPGWEELIGRPLAEVVTEQWVRTMRSLIADLEALAPDRWCVTDYDALADNRGDELARLYGFLGLDATGLQAQVEIALAPPDRDAELGPYLPRTEELAERARDWLAVRSDPVPVPAPVPALVPYPEPEREPSVRQKSHWVLTLHARGGASIRWAQG